MLKGLNPLLNADLLYALRAMGHGDELAIVDVNFPAESVARATTLGRLLHMDGASAPAAVGAVLSLLPLDSFVESPASRMEVVGAPGEMPEVQGDVQRTIDAVEGKATPLRGIERYAFYERARAAFAVLQTGEQRFYGCFIFTKGVVPPA